MASPWDREGGPEDLGQLGTGQWPEATVHHPSELAETAGPAVCLRQTKTACPSLPNPLHLRRDPVIYAARRLQAQLPAAARAAPRRARAAERVPWARRRGSAAQSCAAAPPCAPPRPRAPHGPPARNNMIEPVM